jgi:hypothetical protein
MLKGAGPEGPAIDGQKAQSLTGILEVRTYDGLQEQSVMAKRRRKPSRLDRAAIGIGRALGKALSRIKGFDAEARKAMEVRGRSIQQTGRDAGRKIASLGKSGSTTRRTRSGKATARRGPSSASRRRVAARRKPRRRARRTR